MSLYQDADYELEEKVKFINISEYLTWRTEFVPLVHRNAPEIEFSAVVSDSEVDSSYIGSEKTFLTPSNYKYKRRALVLSNANCCLLAAVSKVLYLREVHRFVGCAKMLNNSPIGFVVLMAIIMSLGFTDMTEAGACWVQRMDNGKCKELYSKNVSREECCGRSQEFAYTDKDMSDAEYFFTAAIGGGTACVSCLDSCDVAKCGPGKRCVIRKGRPRCICAPICKASKEKKLKKHPIRVIDIGKSEKLTQLTLGIPKTREIRSLSEIGHSILDKETESTTLAEKMKNQRKSNSPKRRKQKTNSRIHHQDNIESIQLSSGQEENNSKTVVKNNKNRTNSPRNAENSFKVNKQNKQNVSSKNAVVVQHSQNLDDQINIPHHTRHQYKKHRKIKGQKVDTSTSQNATINIRRQKPLQRIHQAGELTLDEKIRNGFFNHGFPYPPNDLTQIVHGRYYNPVCGTDGKTYKTECQLKKRACRQSTTSLTVAYRGHCQTSCKHIHCLHGLTCVEDQYGIPHCISCKINCPKDDASSVIDPARAVCGVDGQTYKSVCDINRVICTTGRSIAVAYNGPCQDEANCNTIHCEDRKICLTDLVTHKPRCVSCNFKCPRRRRPQGQRYEDVKICGNNNHTYQSWCQMRRDSCNTEFYIDVRHIGGCHKDSFALGIG